MSDILSLGKVADVDAGGSGGRVGSYLDTGTLRRKFNFGDRVSELNLSQDPFFRFVSKVAKKPVDDPEFKFTERRGSWNKRYGYVKLHGAGSAYASDDSAAVVNTVGSTASFKMFSDINPQGNLQNIKGQTSVIFGGTNSEPEFFLPSQIVKINTATSVNQTSASGYLLMKINSVSPASDSGLTGYAVISGTVIKPSGADASTVYLTNTGSTTVITGVTSAGVVQSEETYEPHRCYVVGTVFDKGTGYPETWDDQPFSTAYGMTQIWKSTMAMDNTDRATSLKYSQNEWARIWKEKLIEHKWDIEQSLLFGRQSSTYRTTQGAVDFISQYGNSYSLDIATKTQDDFLDDLSNYLDPRYNNGKASIFFCSTAVYNWLHKLGGYFNNNLSIGSNFRADFAVMGKKKVLGLDSTTISTPYGDMNVVRNIHLDGTNIKLLGINMKHCAYRPLVGNGLNRDTSVYVGVQTLENSGVDRRVDQILTEAGMEWSMPEAHALWTA